MEMIDTRKRKSETVQLGLILCAALAVRLLLAAFTKGYPYDMSCFTAWGDRLAQSGPAAFYADGFFADYPPGYLFVLWLVGSLRAWLGIAYDSHLTYLLLALVPALCDCACAALIWAVARRSVNSAAARRLLLFTAFCPLFLFDTGIWKQIDGVFALPILLAFCFLETWNLLPAALCYGVAFAIKPQALLAGPVLAICFLAAVCRARGARGKLAAIARIPLGAALALAPALLAGLPFFGPAELIPGLIAKYTETSTSYPYATINAFNWFAALGGNWVDQNSLLFGLISWQTLGLLGLAVLTLFTAVLAVRAYRHGRFSPVLLAALYTVGVFTFSHRMHERYLVFGVLLVLLAAARWNDRRLLAAGAGLSLTGFLNLAAVYSVVGTNDEWLTSATSSLFGRVVGFAETVCFLFLAYVVYELCTGGEKAPMGSRARQRTGENPLLAVPAPQPKWTLREGACLLCLTAATAAISFAYLGDLTAPQTPLDATGTKAETTVALAGDTAPATLWVYPGISTGGTLTVQDADTGATLLTVPLDYTTTFCWASYDFAPTGRSWRITVENASVFELSLRSAGGGAVPVTGGGALFDEQALVPERISQLNSMYFDEIYHGRTGYELLHGLTVYETTHPPLGKVFIMAGVALFGMTGFGWRFAGTLFGVLLVPVAYCLARRLTRRRWAAGAAGVLLALDFMRFVQSRIATIDIYGTFFILLGALCMVWYCQSVLQKGVCRSLLPMALGGVAFGLGCASKWTGIYAGVGLAVLYLAVLVLRRGQKQPGFGRELAVAAVGGVVFYIAVPLAIYLASYLPYLWHDPAFSLQDWWNCQTYMYWYHSTLNATHPFESRWYTWGLILRPVWYYMGKGLPAGTAASIAGLGGPVVWLGGLAAMLVLAWRQLAGRGTRSSGALLVLYAAQLVPWMLVTRCTFLYHYFPSSMFGLGALALLLGSARDQKRAKKIALGLCAVSAVLFVWFYPALSGLPVPTAWAASLQLLPSWGFYSL